ncbi:TolC family protein [Thalassotalea ponticola]|uniref:TolC family protein n=1 Tax=Thalassotalea ponticola TaxID=1523392 RepID=UPI0025B4ABEA|nr:TolC family protein [Thalassotalea ponticola]MDN3651850.1 TolC family protein [Thalassotalea ponticola]
MSLSSKAKFIALFGLMQGAIINGAAANSTTIVQPITLEQAVELAQQNDPWLHSNTLQQQALEQQSVAAGTLPDPTVSLSLMNMPTDSWDFGQEGMTQLKVGVTQKFVRGDSLAIKQQQLAIESSKFPLLRENRQAMVKRTVAELWLDAYLAQQTVALIEADRTLFLQMAEIATANYANVIGNTKQQDVIRAQLELIQLDDRLTVEQQKLETALARLHEWLYVYDVNTASPTFDFDKQVTLSAVDSTLPVVVLNRPSLLNQNNYSRNALAQELATHPAVLAIDVQQQAKQQAVLLAKQQYKPQWAVNASYGYRDNTPAGDDRADLFSLGVSFDVPLFTANKQDKTVAASVAESEAVKTEKLLLIKQMISAVEAEVKQLHRLSERQALYQQQLLTQTHDHAEATLTAYTNDNGNFVDVVRARISELNARISALQIDVNALKTVARINYFLPQPGNTEANADERVSTVSAQNLGEH